MFFSKPNIPECPIFTEESNNFQIIANLDAIPETSQSCDDCPQIDRNCPCCADKCPDTCPEGCPDTCQCGCKKDDEETETVTEDDENIIYVITVNGVPQFSTNKFEIAQQKIDKTAKLYNLNYKGYIDYLDESEIEIVRSCSFLFFTYNITVSHIKIHKVNFEEY